MTATWRRSRRADAGVHELARDATMRVRLGGRAALGLRVVDGCVMVTREGDPKDHVLEGGDELWLVGRGLVVAWALSPARLVVSRSSGTRPARAARRDGALASA